jgi:hypothetical protein
MPLDRKRTLGTFGATRKLVHQKSEREKMIKWDCIPDYDRCNHGPRSCNRWSDAVIEDEWLTDHAVHEAEALEKD